MRSGAELIRCRWLTLVAVAGACGGSEVTSRPDGGSGGGAGGATFDAAPSSLDDVTVFGFSQSVTGASDPQVLELAPDINIRAWQRWNIEGTKSSDYDFSYVEDCHAAGVAFVGGSTATALFRQEAASSVELADWATRDASGQMVVHTSVAGLHRGSLANPAYRDYIVGIAKLQIDGGVDGLFFDEVNGSFDGAAYDGNEGYDDYHLADFTAFLLAKYPDAGAVDWQQRFGMAVTNLPRRDVPTSDLTANFDYRKYLADKGWSSTPATAANPLAAEWGRVVTNRPGPDTGLSGSFLQHQVAYVYWKDIVDRVRAYARDAYGREVLITSNGLFPYVDFQSVGLYDYNHDGPGGAAVDYVPTTAGHLDGTVSLQSVFRALRAGSQAVAGPVPVVLFLDWPTGNMDRYDALPASERQDYWRLYAAEAYANGLFFAFHLKTTTGEPTATELGVMPTLKELAAFYRAHAALYHRVTPADSVGVTVAASGVNVSVMSTGNRSTVHLVNHNYSSGFMPVSELEVTLPLASAPASVTLASPDQTTDGVAQSTYTEGMLRVRVPRLVSYTVVIIELAS